MKIDPKIPLLEQCTAKQLINNFTLMQCETIELPKEYLMELLLKIDELENKDKENKDD